MEKSCSKCKIVKPFGCFHKHKGKPFDLALWCKDCAIENARKYYKNKDRDERLAVKRVWQDKNRSHVNAYNDMWRKNNPHKHAARQSKRRASKINATPNWLTNEQLNQIKELYKLCKKFEKVFNNKYHVDHIVPLKGEDVCGLHVPWNLQILQASLNLKKSNKFCGEKF